jgi:hypothetical protein
MFMKFLRMRCSGLPEIETAFRLTTALRFSVAILRLLPQRR